MDGPTPFEQPEALAIRAAWALAIDPAGLGGIVLEGQPGPGREAWLAGLRASLPGDAPWRRAPAQIADDRLLGGLDVAATLATGRPVVASGLLAEADGGVVLVPMAERLPRGTAARIAAVMDDGAVRIEREGVRQRIASRFALVVLDEHLADEDPPPPALGDRLAFHFRTDALPPGFELPPLDAAEREAVRQRLGDVRVPASMNEALCAAAAALGLASVRMPLLAARVARVLAALEGRDEVEREDATWATHLVLLPRATQLPDWPAEDDEEPPEPPPPEEPDGDAERDDSETPDTPGELEDVVLEAAQAVLPPGLLAQLQAQLAPRRRARGQGSGSSLARRRLGRAIGNRAGMPSGGQRLDLLATLKAAAPWQKLRGADPERRRLEVRLDDFRIQRRKARRERVTVFVVDASGSSAAHRLGEVKGAVELLLAECYVRRDQVALIAFRGHDAEVLLPPTRALARARRELAGMPGGGGTPLASGIDTARELADALARKGQDPVIVLLTDGRGNVGRGGRPGRTPGREDAQEAARQFRAAGLEAMVVDTSPRPRPHGAELAEEMGARYLALPRADAAALSGAVRAAQEAR